MVEEEGLVSRSGVVGAYWAVLAGGKGRMWERVVCGSWCVRGCVAPPLVTVKVDTLPETSEGGVGGRRRGVWAVAVAVGGVGVVAGGW